MHARDTDIDSTTGYSRAGMEAYETAVTASAYLRPGPKKKFLAEVETRIRAAEQMPHKKILFSQVKKISRINWSLVLPFFKAADILPRENRLMVQWVTLALELASHDMDVAITFFNRTPDALKHIVRQQDNEALIQWGDQALQTFRSANNTQRIWKAVNAYLIESSESNCSQTLIRWRFLLDQALRISTRSMESAHGFIRSGYKICLNLNQDEILWWINKGLEQSGSEQEIINYFTGISQKSMETGDILTSGVVLKEKQNILSIICEALLGQGVELRSNSVLLGCDGFTGAAATDGKTIYLPDRARDFGFYKLMTLHQAMLLNNFPYTGLDGTLLTDPAQIHADADQRLIQLLPRLSREMDQYPREYPPGSTGGSPNGTAGPTDMPWWGDILPNLLQKTDDTLTWIQDKASAEYEDIPPELVEALVSSLLASGEREPDALWKLLGEMLDNIELTSPDAEELKESVKLFFYKEWDKNIGDYKLDWCQVRQRLAREVPNDFVQKVNDRLGGIIRLIRKQFMKLKPEMFRKFKAQPNGDSLDMDALVEALTDMHSGVGMSENVYIRRDKKIRDVSVFFLVDLSGSTDEEVNGRKVIDIQKEAMVIMAEALEALGDPYAIYGFSTEGRFRVDLFTVKDFEDDYDDKARYRLGNLQPQGLTRMGTVIRHGATKLDDLSSAVKILVVLTDGRPYDMEYGNLEYAIADTKKAVQEVRSKNIHPFIITSDQQGSDYLKMISPQTECIILPRVELLPTLMPALYRRLTG